MKKLILLVSLLSVPALAQNRTTADQGTPAAQSKRWPFCLSDGSACYGAAANPFGIRLSDGAAFYNTVTGAQLPAALDGSGYLKVHEQGSATVTGTVTANQGGAPWTADVTKFGGTAVSTGTGTGGAGIPRVTISSDSSLAANQSVNVAQMNGVATTMGNGIAGTGVQRVAVASDNTPFAVKVDQTTPGTTNAVSLAQIGSTTTASGNGVVGAGVQRVAIASDNTAFSVNNTPPANQSVNTAQIAGNTTLTGNGITGTGSQRVTIASDNTAFSVNNTPPANQSVNLAQIAGATTLVGNGITGTGSQRVTVASDNTPFPIKVDQTTPGTTNAVSLSHVGSTAVATGNGTVSAGVQRVAIASDNTAFTVKTEPVLVTSANNTGSCVTVTAVSTSVLASFATRRTATIYARETNTQIVYLKLGATATTANLPMPPGSAYNLTGTTVYTGAIDAISASGSQSLCVSEF